MKRIAIACGLAGLLGLSGCAEQQEALIVLGAVAWSADAATGSCIVDPANEALLSHGVLDLSCASGVACDLSPTYFIPVVLQSQLPPRSPSTSNAGVDTNEMQLREVEVSYSMPQLRSVIDDMRAENPSLVHFNAPLATDSLPAGQQKGIIVEAISPIQAEALGRHLAMAGAPSEVTLIVKLVFYAERSGNTAGSVGEIESRDFEFPIKLCNGCLLSCGSCEGGECPGEIADLEWTGGVCGNAQDGAIVPAECLGM